jgi:hypothetical protein
MRRSDLEKQRAKAAIDCIVSDLRGAIERRLADLHRYARLAELVALMAEQARRHPGQPIEVSEELAPELRDFAVWAREKAVQEIREWELEIRRQGISAADIDLLTAWDKPPSSAAPAEGEAGESEGA